jgi:hypothetical protein
MTIKSRLSLYDACNNLVKNPKLIREAVDKMLISCSTKIERAVTLAVISAFLAGVFAAQNLQSEENSSGDGNSEDEIHENELNAVEYEVVVEEETENKDESEEGSNVDSEISSSRKVTRKRNSTKITAESISSSKRRRIEEADSSDSDDDANIEALLSDTRRSVRYSALFED